jgi:hypothetical protein
VVSAARRETRTPFEGVGKLSVARSDDQAGACDAEHAVVGRVVQVADLLEAEHELAEL